MSIAPRAALARAVALKNQIEDYGRILAFLDTHLKAGASSQAAPAEAAAE